MTLKTLSEVREKVLSCTNCELCHVGNGPVPFRGKPSRIMVVGEAPGRVEDEKGRPFAGPAGVLLWRELERVGIEKSTVFAANAVSCFPSRTPNEDHITACRGNLYTQAWICKPRYILGLGRTANWSLGNLDLALERKVMGQVRGNWYSLGWFKYDPCEVMPTYHPAAVLRNKALTRRFREDLKAFAEKVVL